jgi:UDPglucose 6-dehydrogenase
MAESRKLMPEVSYCADPYDAMTGADAVVLLTEWNSYRALDLRRMKAVMRQPIVIDLRNIYRPAEMRAAGFRYTSIGRA